VGSADAELGDWVEVLTEILEQESKLTEAGAPFDQRLFENCAGADMTALTQRASFVKCWRDDAPGFRCMPMCDELCARGSLPV